MFLLRYVISVAAGGALAFGFTSLGIMTGPALFIGMVWGAFLIVALSMITAPKAPAAPKGLFVNPGALPTHRARLKNPKAIPLDKAPAAWQKTG